MKSWGNWALLAASLTLCLVLGEILVRVFLGDAIVLFPRYHAAATYGDFTIRRLEPNTVFWHTSVDGSWRFTTNAQGFRSERDFSYDKPDDAVLRILTLGDSQTQGFEVRQDQTYSAVVERYMDSRGIESEVINTGVSGFSTAEPLVFLENEGLKYNPDVVILGFFSNDFSDNVKAGLFKLENDELVVQKTHHTPGISVLRIHNAFWPLRWLSENSYLYSFAMNTAWNTAKEALLSKERAMLVTEFAVPVEEIGNYEKQLAASLITKLHQICQENGILLIILDIPEMHGQRDFNSSIPPDLMDEFMQNSDILIASETVLAPYRQLVEFHVPHGHHHISEFTHLMFGLEAARVIERHVQELRGGVAHAPSKGARGLRPVERLNRSGDQS